MVRMVRSHAISRNLVIDGFPVKISYPGQGFECDICGNSGHIAKNCSLRGKCLECTQFAHFQRNCPVRLCRLQRSVDSLDPLPTSDVSGTPLGALPLDAGPPPVVLSGVPPIAPLANQSDEVASHPVQGSCEESFSVEVPDNQLDEFAIQSILANVSVYSPVSASAGSFGIQFGSSQLCSETQIHLRLLILLLVMSLVIMIVVIVMSLVIVMKVLLIVILVNIVLRIVMSWQIQVLLKRILVKVML